jgi:uncharacterized membrane protein (DUF485 family)
MTGRRIEFLVYLVGIVLLGAFQTRLRTAIGSDAIAFGVALGYLAFLRALGWALRKGFAKDERKS